MLRIVLLSVLLIVLAPAIICAQDSTATNDKWQPLTYFLGSWEGEVSGMSGQGVSERTYELAIQDVYLSFKNMSSFEPQEQNPEGEVHEDWGIFSFDKKRELFVLRQFNVEGFVNQYVMDSVSADGKTMVFTTEAVENGPEGLRARLVVTIEGEDSFTEQFQLAFPGKDFSPCNENRFKRKK